MDLKEEAINMCEPEISSMSNGSSPGTGSLEIDERATPERELSENNSDSHVNDIDPEEFAIQQRTMLERLKEQFSNFPFSNFYPNVASLTPSPSSEETNSESHRNEFPSPNHKAAASLQSISSPSSKRTPTNGNSDGDGYYHGNGHHEEFKQLYQLYDINDDPDRKEFLDDLFQFMKKRGTPITRLPIMAKSVLDLYELFKLVIARGGLVNVINKKLWQEIIKDLNLPSSITSAAFTLRTQYTKYLYPYECEKYNMSTDAELKIAIENNKRDGSRRSTSNNFNQFQQQSPQIQIPDMASTLAAVNPALNLSSVDNVQIAQQKLMMMMLLYQQMMVQSQTQPKT